jgi:hypothetical protein
VVLKADVLANRKGSDQERLRTVSETVFEESKVPREVVFRWAWRPRNDLNLELPVSAGAVLIRRSIRVVTEDPRPLRRGTCFRFQRQ